MHAIRADLSSHLLDPARETITQSSRSNLPGVASATPRTLIFGPERGCTAERLRILTGMRALASP